MFHCSQPLTQLTLSVLNFNLPSSIILLFRFNFVTIFFFKVAVARREEIIKKQDEAIRDLEVILVVTCWFLKNLLRLVRVKYYPPVDFDYIHTKKIFSTCSLTLRVEFNVSLFIIDCQVFLLIGHAI